MNFVLFVSSAPKAGRGAPVAAGECAEGEASFTLGVLKTIVASFSSFGVTTGTVSIVLPIAMRRVAVKASLVTMRLSSRTLTKMIMISALV